MTTPPIMPDFIAPVGTAFFVTPRWNVKIFVSDVLVCVFGWISAQTEAMAVAHVHSMGFTDAVRYEVTEVQEFGG